MTVRASGSASPRLSEPDVTELLTRGRLEVLGRLLDASNVTLLGQVEATGVTLRCIYKPIRGERPLWDFPDGALAHREVAAHAVSAAAGWDCVPPTVLRSGPLGRGMVQQWIGPDPMLTGTGSDGGDGTPGEPDDVTGPTAEGSGDGTGGDSDAGDDNSTVGDDLVAVVPAGEVPGGWRPVLRAFGDDGQPLVVCHADDPRLALIAGFDLVVNNADRKAPHLLTTPDRRILGVDHGLTFHTDDKLRTILWGWAGERLPDQVVDGLQRLGCWLQDAGDLDPLLTIPELRRLSERIAELLADPVFPDPPDDRTPIPWPPL